MPLANSPLTTRAAEPRGRTTLAPSPPRASAVASHGSRSERAWLPPPEMHLQPSIEESSDSSRIRKVIQLANSLSDRVGAFPTFLRYHSGFVVLPKAGHPLVHRNRTDGLSPASI